MPKPGDIVYVLAGEIWNPKVFEIVWGGNDPQAEQSLFGMGCVWKTLEYAKAAAAAIKKGFER
jgi:hypothetical protein